jgi:hypothetical protein
MKQVVSILVLLALLGGSVIAAAQPRSGSAKKKSPAANPVAPMKTKVATGRYELRRADGPVERTFEEVWILYKTKVGYSVEEQWHVGPGKDVPANVLDVSLDLIPGLHPLNMRIGTDEQRSLRCSLALTECKCSSMGMEATLPMNGAYSFFSPSPWMIGSIVRRSRKVPGETTTVQLVRMAGMTAEGPRLASFNAEVQYVGDDQILISGQRLDASIFELKAPQSIPDMLIWVSRDGLVLALQDSAKQEQRLELTEYTRHGRF